MPQGRDGREEGTEEKKGHKKKLLNVMFTLERSNDGVLIILRVCLRRENMSNVGLFLNTILGRGKGFINMRDGMRTRKARAQG